MHCDSVTHAFNECATQYDRLANVQQRIANQFFSTVKRKENYAGTLLDIGCGTGFLTKELRVAYSDAGLIALDSASEMLACLPEMRGLAKVCADFNTIPLPDQSCDAVFSSAALQWSQDTQSTLQEWLRVLKPGGELCFSTLLYGTLAEWDRCWSEVGESRRVNALLTIDQLRRVQLSPGCEWVQIQNYRLTDFHLTTKDALASVREIGAGKRLQGTAKSCLMGRGKWQSFLSAYEQMRTDQGLPLSYEVLYGTIKKK